MSVLIAFQGTDVGNPLGRLTIRDQRIALARLDVRNKVYQIALKVGWVHGEFCTHKLVCNL